MQNALNAAAPTAGALMSTSTFEVPIYQREYAWTLEEVEEFWSDLLDAQNSESYFLGLLILTQEKGRYHVVDGQQRILTLTLLAAALRGEALKHGRKTLAAKLESDFLKTINYATDETESRVVLSDAADDRTLQKIVDGEPFEATDDRSDISQRITDAYVFLRGRLQRDIGNDTFRKLGTWTEFITDKLYFAVFIHPDARSAYKVFEAINTRGRDLTTAELLKNYVLSETPTAEQKKALYEEWQSIAQAFPSDGSNSFVQYIRHVVTTEVGHVLPKDLFDLIAGRGAYVSRQDRPTINKLMQLIKEKLQIYSQMIDVSLPGPLEGEALDIFSALNSLSVISVRPILLSIVETQGGDVGPMRDLLRLVLRRIVVGNLGTGNVERRFGEAAKALRIGRVWARIMEDLADLMPSRDDFVGQLSRRSLNKQTLAFIRRSVVQGTMYPVKEGYFHLIRPKQAYEWEGFQPEEITFWTNTIGNTFLVDAERRHRVANWEDFKQLMLPDAVAGELTARLETFDDWDAEAVEQIGVELAEVAANVWY
jgi:hypothetical protein